MEYYHGLHCMETIERLEKALAESQKELKALRKIADLCKEEIEHGFDLPSEVQQGENQC